MDTYREDDLAGSEYKDYSTRALIHAGILSVRTSNTLKRRGCTTIGQMMQLQKTDILRMNGLGKAAVVEIQNAQEACRSEDLYLREPWVYGSDHAIDSFWGGFTPCALMNKYGDFIDDSIEILELASRHEKRLKHYAINTISELASLFLPENEEFYKVVYGRDLKRAAQVKAKIYDFIKDSETSREIDD